MKWAVPQFEPIFSKHKSSNLSSKSQAPECYISSLYHISSIIEKLLDAREVSYYYEKAVEEVTMFSVLVIP
jgi:hypothetical protein